jgi:predicted flavoprotein YhiN
MTTARSDSYTRKLSDAVVIIVGAGPAGLACANALARASHSVRGGNAFDAWGQAYPIRGERRLYHLVHRENRSSFVNSKLHIKSDSFSSTFRLPDATAFHGERNREVGVRP